jgi:hypothetical protein
MEIVVICADCRNEYKAEAAVRFWKCEHCGHEKENGMYPFLTRRVAHAKSHRSETNWEAMFDELMAEARERVLTLEGRLRRLEAERRQKPGAGPEPPAAGDPGAGAD